MIAVFALAAFVQSLPAEEVVIEAVGEAGLIVTAGERQVIFDHFPMDADRLPDAVFITNGNADSLDQAAALSFMEAYPDIPVLVTANAAARAIESGGWPAFGGENWEAANDLYYNSLETLVPDHHAPLNCLRGEALAFLGPVGFCGNGYVGWDRRRFSDDENVFYVLELEGRLLTILGNFKTDEMAVYHWEREFIPPAEIVVFPATLAVHEEGRLFLDRWFAESYRIAYRLPDSMPPEVASDTFGEGHVLSRSGERVTVEFETR